MCILIIQFSHFPEPIFIYEPMNVTAQPVNGTASAAFSCAISPADDLAEIQWLFEAMSFGSGSGMGLTPGPSSGMLSNDMDNVTIHQPADSGTSILILDSVGNDYEGLYSCVAVFPEEMRTSSEATLKFNRECFMYQFSNISHLFLSYWTIKTKHLNDFLLSMFLSRHALVL